MLTHKTLTYTQIAGGVKLPAKATSEGQFFMYKLVLSKLTRHFGIHFKYLLYFFKYKWHS